MILCTCLRMGKQQAILPISDAIERSTHICCLSRRGAFAQPRARLKQISTMNLALFSTVPTHETPLGLLSLINSFRGLSNMHERIFLFC